MIKIDMHLHSKHSDQPLNYLLKHYNFQESYADPTEMYLGAKKRGMTHFTLTDHNTIDGAAELAGKYDDVWVSEEVTAFFPEDNVPVHILTYVIDEKIHQDLMKARENIHVLSEYIHQNGIRHSVAHPFEPVNGSQYGQHHLEQMLVLFDFFELNGNSSERQNHATRDLVTSLTAEKLAKLAEKHRIENPRLDPSRKSLTCGSDDHTGFMFGRSYLFQPGDSVDDIFENPGLNEPVIRHSTPIDLSYALYSIGMQHIKNSFDMRKLLDIKPEFKTLYQLLTLQEPPRTRFPKSLLAILKRKLVNRLFHEIDPRGSFLKHLQPMPLQHLDYQNAPEKTFDYLTQTINKALASTIQYAVTAKDNPMVYPLAIGAGTSLEALLVPIHFGFKEYGKYRKFCEKQDLVAIRQSDPKVAFFTDTYQETNGVAKTLQELEGYALRHGKGLEILTSVMGKAVNQEKNFEPIYQTDLPRYPELKLSVPDLPKLLNYVYHNEFNLIHAKSIGPMGLAALYISKVTHTPFVFTYNTRYPQFVREILGQEKLEHLAWKYVAWYCNLCDKVLVLNDEDKKDLMDNGVKPTLLEKWIRGTEIDQFNFDNDQLLELPNRNTLLFVGRISPDKNVDVLVQSYLKLVKRYPDLKLIFTGDGPATDELKARLNGYPVEFTGYLEGQALVDVFKRASIFTFPSKHDTYGRAVIEALASGLPVVVSDLGGPKENIIHGETGMIVKTGKSDAEYVTNYTEAIDHLLRNRHKLPMMGKAAVASSKAHGKKLGFDRLWKIYDAILREDRPVRQVDFSTGDSLKSVMSMIAS